MNRSSFVTTPRRARITAGLALSVLGAAGCVLPISYTEPASPEVIGWYRRTDGMPATGARVVVTNDGEDRTCRRPLGVGITDSAGVFQLPPAMVQRRGVWLVPAFERFTNDYWICVSSADSVLHMAYRGVMFLRGADPAASAVDSLVCVEWAWEDSLRVTCGGPNERRSIQVAGRWTDGNTAGYYRLIVVEPHWDTRDEGVFVQWVEGEMLSGAPEIVRATTAIPFARRIYQLEEAELLPGESGRPACVSVRAGLVEASFWTWKRQYERGGFVLGPPGEMRRVEHCADRQ